MSGRQAFNADGACHHREGNCYFCLVHCRRLPKAEAKRKSPSNRYEPAQIQKLVAELREKAGRASESSRHRENRARTDPSLWQTSGNTGACRSGCTPTFLRSTIWFVSESPLLLRKHRYLDFGPQARHAELLSQSRLINRVREPASYFLEASLNWLAAGTAASVAEKTEGTPQ